MQLSELKDDIDELCTFAYDAAVDNAILNKIDLGKVPAKYHKYIKQYVEKEEYTFSDVLGDYLFENYYLSRDIITI